MHKQLPNILTIFRIVIIPLLVASFYLPGLWANIVGAALFLIAGVTDFWDGHLARKWNVQSKLGELLDPIADKLLVLTSLVMLVEFQRAEVIAVVVIIIRETMVSGLREFLADTDVHIPSSVLSKIKTAMQMLAIFMLIFFEGGDWYYVCNGVLWLAAILSIITGYAYWKAGLKHIISDMA